MALTLVECLLALVILSFAVLGLTYATVAGRQHVYHGDISLRAVRLAEHLMEEIQSRPYAGSGGGGRSTYHVDDYDGFQEAPGTLKDFAGLLYPAEDQVFTRTVSIAPSMQMISDLENRTITGKIVVITIQDGAGTIWQLSRFIPEPVSP